MVTHKLCPQDQFVIFASDGLWEHLSNQEAVDIVQNHPHNVRLQYLLCIVTPLILFSLTEDNLRDKIFYNLKKKKKDIKKTCPKMSSHNWHETAILNESLHFPPVDVICLCS